MDSKEEQAITSASCSYKKLSVTRYAFLWQKNKQMHFRTYQSLRFMRQLDRLLLTSRLTFCKHGTDSLCTPEHTFVETSLISTSHEEMNMNSLQC